MALTHGPEKLDTGRHTAFLLSQGWHQVQVITRRKSWTKGNPPEWIFQGLKPDGSPADQSTWFYADEDTQLSVGPVPPRKRIPAEATSIPGPRKRWVDQEGKASNSNTVSDEAPRSGVFSVAQGVVRTIDGDSGLKLPEQRKPKRDAVVTQEAMDWDGEDENPIFHPPHLGAAMTQIDEDVDLMTDEELAARADARLLAELPEGWDFHEVGGSGDCAFRAIAWALSRAQNKQIEDPEALQREAARLRLLSVGHIGNHAARFSESWAADPEESKSDRAGQTSPITTFAESKEAAAGRHFYADGIMLQALSERIACPLVIWAWNPELDMWNRSVIAPWFTSDSTAGVGKKGSPLVLALRGKHYRALESSSSSGGNIPTAWLRQTSARPRAEFRGGGKTTPRSEARRQSPALSGKTKVSLSGGLSLPSSTPRRAPSGASGLSLPSSTPARGSGSLSSRAERSAPKTRCFSSPDPVPLPKGAFGGSLGHSRAASQGQKRKAALSLPSSTPRKASLAQAVLSLCSATPGPSKRSRTAAPSKDRLSEAAPSSVGLCSSFSGTSPRCLGSKPEKQKMRVPKGPNGDSDKVRKMTSKTCYPSQGAGTGWLPWWSCDQPNCSFKVMRHPIVRGHHEARRYHLTKVHGIEKVPRLPDGGPTTKRRRTKKEEALATQAKIEGVRARQRGNNNTVSTKPKPIRSSLFAVKDSEAGPDPWWRCDWPDCSFSLEQDASNKTYRRQQHLKQAHGLKRVPDLRTVGGLASLPVRQTAADSVFDKRWQLTHANFLKKIWKTAHRIECEPCSFPPPKTRAAHRCELCGIEVQRGEVPLSICKMAKGISPPLAKRKQIWKECRVAASKELGCKRTLRKERKKGAKSVKGKGSS